MFGKALMGLVVTCVVLTPVAAAADTDIVLYASDSSNLHGNWARVPDATAAGGVALSSSDAGWSNTAAALSAPADYVDFTFNAPALTPFHVWMRLRAGGNSKYNDSVFAQFSDAVNVNFAPVLRMGTTDALCVNLAGDATAAGLSGWGWQDGAYWLSQPTTIMFATGGLHTLRVQTREDGVSLDQVVLRPASSTASSPGLSARDTTIVSKWTGVPAPWSNRDVGVTGIAGGAWFANGQFVVSGAGADIWGTADAFQFVSLGAPGDAQLVTRVVTFASANTFAKAGVMFRDTPTAGSAHVILDVRPNGSIEFMSRAATGAGTTFIAGGTRPAPAWLRLTRSGTTFRGEVSPDGATWTLIGTANVALSAVASAGMVVTSHNTAVLATGVFDGVSLVQAPSTPALPTPSTGTSGFVAGSALTWSAPGSSSYDLRFGTANPPPAAAAGLTTAQFVPTGLAPRGTYFWQVIARNAVGATAGPIWSFSTTGAAPTPPVGPRNPVSYSAVTDRNPYAKPALPSLGAAGFQFADPTFGSRILRVTDGRTRPGMVNRSFRVPSNAHLSAWNSSSTAFYVISNDGTVIPYVLDPVTMTASRIQASTKGNGGLTLTFYVEPQFSLVKPNIIFGAVSGTNGRTISQYDFQSGDYTKLLNLDTIADGLKDTYIGGIMTGGTPAENLVAFFGGSGQDNHYYALWTPVANLGARKLLNTLSSTINGVPTATPLNFRLHSIQIDRSGRFVFLYPASADLGSPRGAAQVYVWDTASDAVTAVTAGMHPGGHDASGYGTWINMDCCTSSSWDAAQWQFRDLSSLSQTSDLIAPVQAVKEVYLADHSTWNNAQPATLVPVISSTYRVGTNPAPWRAWDDEIIAVDTANGGGGNVWRFAHHRSDVASDTNPAAPYFWYEPIANVSPDGKWVVFTSNWEKTLGTDSSEGTSRQDVFLVQLTPLP